MNDNTLEINNIFYNNKKNIQKYTNTCNIYTNNNKK